MNNSVQQETYRRVFVVFIYVLIVLNIMAVILETVDSLSYKYGYAFKIFEYFSVAVFSAEYLLRIWTCTNNKRFKGPVFGRVRYSVTPLALIDLLAVLPFYLPLIIPMDLRFIRALRLFRLFRIFKLSRYGSSLEIMGNVIKAKKEELVITAVAGIVLLIISSSLMYYIEHNAQPIAFPNIPATMWWGVTALTTVGYGDVYPVTPVGKILGSLIAFLGVGMFALPAGLFAAGFADEIQKRRVNKQDCPRCGNEID